MRIHRKFSWNTWFATVVALLAGVFATAACGDDSSANTTADGGGFDATTASPSTDGGPPSDAPAAPPQTLLRIAHLSPDAPAIDVCVAPHGTTTFQGPLVAGLASSLGLTASTAGGAIGNDGGVIGLSFTEVSAYISLDPGAYDVRIVAAGASSCDVPLGAVPLDAGAPTAAGDAGDAGDADASDAGLLGDADAGSNASDSGSDGAVPTGSVPDSTNLPTLVFNQSATLLIAGDLVPVGNDASLTIRIALDNELLVRGASNIRAINAIPSQPTLDLGVETATSWSPLLTNIAFAAASSTAAADDGALDPNGYLPIAPLAGQAFGARTTLDAGVDLASTMSIEIDLGAIATVLAVGGKTGDGANPPRLLLCIDNQPAGGLLADCSVAP